MSQSPKFPTWNFPPIIPSPYTSPKRKSPKKSRLSPKKSPFDFESNIMYPSAQIRTPLKPIQDILTEEEYALFLKEISKEKKPIKRKLKFESTILKSPSKKPSSKRHISKSPEEDEDLESTEVIL
jgi:hypothetical protein